MPRKFENNYFIVDTTFDKNNLRVSLFKDGHYQDEVELKNVPEGEIIKLVNLITNVYLEDEVND